MRQLLDWQKAFFINPLVLAMIFFPAQSRAQEEPFASLRFEMVTKQIEARGIKDKHVLEAMRKVERHRFVPKRFIHEAYEDHPIQIGYGQTISQPYIVALMTELLKLPKTAKVLEVGTGSGYQAAVLAAMGCQVYTIEIVPELAEEAKTRLQLLGVRSVHVKAGDGYLGWPEEAPFDAIMVTAGAGRVPAPLAAQLKEGGVLVMPIGRAEYQKLIVGTRSGGQWNQSEHIPVRFVPMTGLDQKNEE